MPCIVSFIVLAVLGIFSASHRQLAREAFDCVFRRITLRPCNTGFQDKMKGLLVGRILARSVPLARFVNKRFELLSWIFMILTVASLAWFLRGAYLWWTYGSCNGPNNAGFCIFDPTGESNKTTAGTNCGTVQPVASNLHLDAFDLSKFPKMTRAGAKHELVFVGCYGCQYTRETFPIIQDVLKKNPDVNFTFVHFPTIKSTDFLSAYTYCTSKTDETKFWDYNQAVFALPIEKVTDPAEISKVLTETGYDAASIVACTQSPETQQAVQSWNDMSKAANIYGTPTIFIDGQPLVGPKPARVYDRALGLWW